MPADMYDAHLRHFEDANFLYGDNRLANADQLYGLSAECGLKAILQQLKPDFWDTNSDKPKNSKDGHIDKLWARYEMYRAGHVLGPKLLLATINPFDNWTTSQRYENRGFAVQHCVEQHKAGAESVRQLVCKAQQEGLL